MNHDDSHPVDRAENVVIGRASDGSITLEIEAELCDEGCGRRVRYDVLRQIATCGCVRTAPEPCIVPTRPMVVGRLREALRLVTSDWPLSTPPAGVSIPGRPIEQPPALSPESIKAAAPMPPERPRDPDDVRVVHRESIPILRVHKAQRIIASQETPSMCIVASDELDSRKAFGPALGSADLPQARAFYAKEASSIFGVLVESLPGGTIDALLVRMLEHKRSLFVVSHDAIAKKEG